MSSVRGLQYIECHAWRHDWEEIAFSGSAKNGVYQEWRCTQCAGVKRERWSINGVFISRQYKMPFDYKGPPFMTKADYRKVWFGRKFKNQRNLKLVHSDTA